MVFNAENLGDIATAWYGASAAPPLAAPVPVQSGLGEGALVAGRYRIGQAMGAGDFASVYTAWDLSLERWVAIKVYRAETGGQISADEVRLQATCQHPNLMPLYDAGSDPLLGVAYLVMPLYPGSDLAAMLDRYGPLPFRAALLCVDQVCSALEFLWQRRQVVHGDVQPANIWLTHSGAALLMGFDLHSLLARGGSRTGMPGYTASEVWEGRRDPRSDVFSVGCVLYRCLAGEAPFADDQAARSGQFTPLRRLRPDLWPELEAVVHTALAADPAQRFQTVREFQSALRYPGRRIGFSLGSLCAVLWRLVTPMLHAIGALLAVLHRAGWKGLRRFLRYARRYPLQAAVEAVVVWAAGRWALQVALLWLQQHRLQVTLAVIAWAALLTLGSAGSSGRRGWRSARRYKER